MDARDELIEKGARAYYEWATMNPGEVSRYDEPGSHQGFARARVEVILDALLAHPDLVIAALGGKMYQFLDGDFVYRFPVREGTE